MEGGRYGVMVDDLDPKVAWVDERVPYGRVCDMDEFRRAEGRIPQPQQMLDTQLRVVR